MAGAVLCIRIELNSFQSYRETVSDVGKSILMKIGIMNTNLIWYQDLKLRILSKSKSKSSSELRASFKDADKTFEDHSDAMFHFVHPYIPCDGIRRVFSTLTVKCHKI